MRISLYNNFGPQNSTIFQSLESGLRAIGHQVYSHDDSADIAVVFGQVWAGNLESNRAVWQQYQAANKPVVIVQKGCIRNRNLFQLRVNNQKNFFTTGNSQQRANDLGIALGPWRQQGDHILIILQSPYSPDWLGMPELDTWLENTVSEIKSHTDRPIKIKTYPRLDLQPVHTVVPNGCELLVPKYVMNSYDRFDLDQGLVGAWAVVNWGGNAACDAIIHGYPAFTGLDSFAASVADQNLSNIENPAMPDRTQWFYDLACHEWTEDEIATGAPLSTVLASL